MTTFNTSGNDSLYPHLAVAFGGGFLNPVVFLFL